MSDEVTTISEIDPRATYIKPAEAKSSVSELVERITKAMEGVTPSHWSVHRYLPRSSGAASNLRMIWDEGRRGMCIECVPSETADYIVATQPSIIRLFLSALADAERERDELRVGIKRLSDEEELCSETDDADAFDLVRLAAKLARSERKTRDAERELTDTQTAIHAMSADHEEMKAKLAEAVKVIGSLEKAASEVNRYGAQVGPQWVPLTGQLVTARSFLASMKGDAE